MLSCFSHVWLCHPMDCSLSGSSVHRIPQAGVLEWVSTPSFRRSSRPWDQIHVSWIGRQILYHSHHLESLMSIIYAPKLSSLELKWKLSAALSHSSVLHHSPCWKQSEGYWWLNIKIRNAKSGILLSVKNSTIAFLQKKTWNIKIKI